MFQLLSCVMLWKLVILKCSMYVFHKWSMPCSLLKKRKTKTKRKKTDCMLNGTTPVNTAISSTCEWNYTNEYSCEWNYTSEYSYIFHLWMELHQWIQLWMELHQWIQLYLPAVNFWGYMLILAWTCMHCSEELLNIRAWVCIRLVLIELGTASVYIIVKNIFRHERGLPS